MDIAEQIYAFTRPFPREELYGLTSQLRRAASSIPANIAEGEWKELDKRISPSSFDSSRIAMRSRNILTTLLAIEVWRA
ncbi:four helix bundle protein [Bythopirellula polymerisocia]|nr:four helix bundle protein [Bythopirellula polymerisocia]